MTRQAVNSDRSPKPLAHFSPALSIGDLVQVSGQGPLNARTGELEHEGDVALQTRLTLQHVEAILEAAGSSLADALMVRVYLADRAHFGAMNAVYDEFLRDRLAGLEPPARTTLIAGLPLDAMLVEIDVLARKRAGDGAAQ